MLVVFVGARIMKRCARIGFCCLLLFLVTAEPGAFAQIQLGSIIGVIRIIRGSFPPDRIMVRLELHGGTVATTYADYEGRFSFNSLQANPYRIVISDERFSPVEMLVNVNPGIIPTNIVQVMLTPRDKPAAANQGKSKDYVVSLSDFTKNIPKNAVKEFERGAKKESEGQADEAIEHYLKAIKEAPNLSVAHNNLGSLYVGKSDFLAAQKEFADSIRLAPGDSKAYFNMANLMLLTGKLQDAERFLQDGFRTQPDSAFGFFVQGSVLERNGKLPDAERALQRALELDPKLTRPHLELVNLYLRQERPADAIAELHKFLQVAPTDPLAPKAREVLNKLQSAGSSPRP